MLAIAVGALRYFAVIVIFFLVLTPLAALVFRFFVGYIRFWERVFRIDKWEQK